MTPEVVEYAAGIAPQLMGDYVEHVATGMDTYSIRQPLGVRARAKSFSVMLSPSTFRISLEQNLQVRRCAMLQQSRADQEQ